MDTDVPRLTFEAPIALFQRRKRQRKDGKGPTDRSPYSRCYAVTARCCQVLSDRTRSCPHAFLLRWGMTGKSPAECDRRSMRYYPINCPQEVTPRRDSPLARNAAEVGVRPSDFIAHDREAHDFCSEEVKHRVPPARNCSSKIAHLSQATTLEQSDMAR